MTKKITKEMINNWKEEHGHIYRVTIDGEDIIFRRLKRSEYIKVLKDTGDISVDSLSATRDKAFERQELFLRHTVIYPEDVDNLIENSAGIATILADEILMKSGFVNVVSEEL